MTLVSSYFNGQDDIFIISGDMISTKNIFLNNFSTNMMAAINRDHDNIKEDWSYKLNKNGNIIDIIKSKKRIVSWQENEVILLKNEQKFLVKI